MKCIKLRMFQKCRNSSITFMRRLQILPLILTLSDNLHSIVACMSRTSLLEISVISEL